MARIVAEHRSEKLLELEKEFLDQEQPSESEIVYRITPIKSDEKGTAEEEDIHVERRNGDRLQRERRTPEAAYYQPILQILNELGGSAKMSDLQERLAQVMKGVLKGIDYETLVSGAVRWRNTAQFARNTMVKDGRLKSNSPHGIWEITESGRMSLTKGAN